MAEWVNRQTGEVMILKLMGGRNVSRETTVTRAFIRASEGRAAMWTVGSSDKGIARISQDAQAFGQWLTKEAGVDWIIILEPGSQSCHWHLHCVVNAFIKWDIVRDSWQRIRGEEGLHVDVRQVAKGDRIAYYVSKYLRKEPDVSRETIIGYRRFRSSKGLRKRLAKYIVQVESEKRKVEVWMGWGESDTSVRGPQRSSIEDDLLCHRNAGDRG